VTATLDLDAGLHRLGLEQFRPGQREAIETLLDSGRLLLVAPTGGGKSLVYQLPAALLPGTTLVVSPLIALMHDQVRSLEERGVPATFLASTLDASEHRRRTSELASGRYKLIYVAPERLVLPGFQDLLQRIEVPLVAIDEAHCISEWGHDFRPEYLELGPLLESIAPPRVLACTATATPVVRDEIVARLGLDASTPQLVRGFARPNLALRVREVRGARERERAVDALLTEALGGPERRNGASIVYAPTRRATEAEAARLSSAGWRVQAYHAGLDGSVRDSVQRAFSAAELEVVVATNAFGMGIDRPDVRAVLHLAPPGSVEAYYQEVGRAGRDDKDALGLLLVSASDLPQRRRLIERDGLDPEVLRHKWNMFLELMRWCEGGSCRHDAILRYFGDEAETLAGCGRCDVCLSFEQAASDPDEVSLVVRKALSAVARVHGRFGLGVAVLLLRGQADERLERAGLDRSPSFGTLRDRDDEWLKRLLRRCVTAGWVDFQGTERPVVVLTEEGRVVMRGEHEARLLLPADTAATPLPPGTRRSKRASAKASDDALDPAEAALFEALRRKRLERARAAGVPPYVIASDRALRDVARLRPRTLQDLEHAHGIGPSRARRHGPELLEVIRSFEAESAADSG
jgi:ATP-dependent DNA helicase RecQ